VFKKQVLGVMDDAIYQNPVLMEKTRNQLAMAVSECSLGHSVEYSVSDSIIVATNMAAFRTIDDELQVYCTLTRDAFFCTESSLRCLVTDTLAEFDALRGSEQN
jgi:hypothetical protein